jgi:hypothetical protein
MDIKLCDSGSVILIIRKKTLMFISVLERVCRFVLASTLIVRPLGHFQHSGCDSGPTHGKDFVSLCHWSQVTVQRFLRI